MNITKNKEKVKEISVGLLAGLISGLFAAGGGMIVVPALINVFKIDDAKARATSVFTILPMAIASGFSYYKNEYIDWNLGIKCAIGGIIGGVVGARLLNKVSTHILKLLFTFFLIYTSARMMFM